MRFKAKENLLHGDWKTRSVFPERWPTIPAGTEVEGLNEWTNFYGRWQAVIGPNGETYDVEPWKLDAIVAGEKT